MKQGKLKEITIKRAHKGVIIRHEHESPKHGPASGTSITPDDYDSRRPEYAFNDHAAAEAHLAKHLPSLLGDGVDSEPDNAGDQEFAPKDVKPRSRFQRG